jgi:glucose/arabinose dehydrogenase
MISIAAMTLVAGSAAHAQQLTTQRLLTGLTRPVFATTPPGDNSRLFIVEQRGSGGVSTQAYIRILNLSTNTLNATPFLTVTGLSTGSEQGLLGLAFDPNYASNGRFYINYTNTAGTTIIARYTVSANPDIANPAGTNILTQSQPFSNHNGGWMAFGPDGYLYIAMGDGGSGGDPNNAGQNVAVLLGKLLRIDVSGGAGYSIPPTNPFFGSTSARQEIWAYGLRNPWRNAFDRVTGDLYIADVGQDVWEEINFQPAATTSAINYGWRCYEGNAAYNTSGCQPAATMKFPFHTYSHSTGCSITGGYVYRGCAMPTLRGTYFFADYCTNQIWSLRYDGTTVSEFTNRTSELAVAGQTINAVVSFAEDANGEMYILDQGGGELYKIVPRCAANCDGSTGTPLLTSNDFQCFLNRFAANDCYANCDGSTGTPILTANDFQCFLNRFAAGCS